MLRRLFYVFMISVLSVPALAQDNPPPAAPTTLPGASTVSMPPVGELKDLPPMDARALDDSEPIRLSSDGPAVINLDRDAATVIVGNPNNASVVMESPRMLMLMPGAPGATKVMVLDKDGKSILNRHVLVGGGKTGFIRINRICSLAGNKACAAQSTYYCPDRCYETTAAATAEGGATAGAAAAPAETGLPPNPPMEDDSSAAIELVTPEEPAE